MVMVDTDGSSVFCRIHSQVRCLGLRVGCLPLLSLHSARYWPKIMKFSYLVCITEDDSQNSCCDFW